MRIKKYPTDEKSKKKTLLVKPGIKWYDVFDVPYDDSDSAKSCPAHITKDLKSRAQQLLDEDVQHYKNFLHMRKERSDFNWIQTVLRTGTLADKMAAHTVLIQDSAVYNLVSIDSLAAMVKIKGKRECLMAIDTLRDLFLSDLLPQDKKLKTFEMHPLAKLDELCSGNIEVKNRRLLLWYFEEELKRRYVDFLKAVEKVGHDSVETTKQKAVAVMAQLLRFNPEQEQFLLPSLVNKLGDPLKRIAARVVGHMNQVVNTHPNMKGVIIDEMERLLYRPNVGPRAQYYVLCFLSQLIFNLEDKKVATHLIGMYFGFFKLCIKKSEVDSKLMSALLTGVARAFPYIDRSKASILQEQLDALYKVIHMVKFNIRVQALMLIFQALDNSEGPTDRFYSVLYRILSATEVSSSSRQATFLNLLYRALKKDPSVRRVRAFVKRLLQMCQYYPSSLVCGVLFLITELVQLRPAVLQVDRKAVLFQDSDDEEHYEDAPADDDEEQAPTINNKTGPPAVDEIHKPSWIHIQNLNKKDIVRGGYDPLHRNPLYCGAENEELWELPLLHRHYHPSVATFAKSCSSGTKPDYSGDPLQDFTLIHFLDRFVYRNPKNLTKSKAEATDGHKKVFGRRTLYVPKGSRSLPVNSEAYLNQKKERVAVEELFLHQYLSQRAAKKAEDAKRDKGEEDVSDIESVASDEFERLLDKFEPGMSDNVDFAGGVAKKKGKKGVREESDEDEQADSFGDDDDVSFGDDEEFNKAFEDFDEDLEDAGGNFDFEDAIEEPSSKRKRDENLSRNGNKRKKGIDSGALFASAEQFSSLLDEHSGSKLDTTTAQALANKDNADAKQLAWETARDRWVRDVDWKSQKGQKGNKRTGRFKKFGRRKSNGATKRKKFKK